jgi:hypothetical protein
VSLSRVQGAQANLDHLLPRINSLKRLPDAMKPIVFSDGRYCPIC